MVELERCFCPNQECKDYGLRNRANIAVRGKYGKDKSRDLLYCRTCGKRFAATQSSALFGLHLPAGNDSSDHPSCSRRRGGPGHGAPAGVGQRHGKTV